MSAASLRAACLVLLTLLLSLLALPARAHEMSMAEMEVRETAPGEFLWLWSASSDKRPMGDDLEPRWPDSCREAGANVVHCDDDSTASSSMTGSGGGWRPSSGHGCRASAFHREHRPCVAGSPQGVVSIP